MQNTLLSFTGVTIRPVGGRSFTNISLDVNNQEHLAVVGQNEPLKNALLDAIAGTANIVSGKTKYPFYKDYLTANTLTDPLLSPHKLFAVVSGKHSFRTLSNTSDFYYQQRFNSTDSENALKVSEFLNTVKYYDQHAHWTVKRTIEKLHLEPLLDEELIKLSNGETKRVMIAAAVLRNPVLLLLSNPLTGLDVGSRAEILKLIDEIANSGITVVIFTSGTELPTCIRQAVVANPDNTITKIPISELKAEAPVNSQEPPNEQEIADLLSIQKMPRFEQIVLMNNVSIRYGENVILDGVSWTIKQGERWALLGHNGAGKSTLLSLINGDNPQAFANDIILFDRKKGSGESIWDIKKKIGFFSSELYQYFPGETNCLHAVESGFHDTIGLFKPSNPSTAAISLRWMKLLGISGLAEKRLRQISLVEQRLCLLARALVKSPVLLILDEPCQGFEPYQQTFFRNLVDTICRVRNITLVYVTHYQEELPESITKTLRLAKGKIVDE
ncbi:ATP-binding cassette domain-containing protein [Segetibacter sp. 3557_3]|uniref:ATP-binding cassette domain-containing protein n=1 Tax=Segetibacter sp. 3557_3 TaxID=2547429 RepID=UPI0010591B92|nr:ATP-binding cassette domain-containing protein [Segetibacter sp. 3557_3]TDH29232.1 ATP-binding cassette domain-containing protein [Segetibacter sp. 3557_3]